MLDYTVFTLPPFSFISIKDRVVSMVLSVIDIFRFFSPVSTFSKFISTYFYFGTYSLFSTSITRMLHSSWVEPSLLLRLFSSLPELRRELFFELLELMWDADFCGI
jgi:hypothetical protein